jgi:hypothetical protein
MVSRGRWSSPGKAHPAQFVILGHARNFEPPQLVPAGRGGDLVGTAAPNLLEEVAPTSRVAARDSKARRAPESAMPLARPLAKRRDSPAALASFPGKAQIGLFRREGGAHPIFLVHIIISFRRNTAQSWQQPDIVCAGRLGVLIYPFFPRSQELGRAVVVRPLK